jgi:pimeloyl-ACP methyl ester carboxylesterase
MERSTSETEEATTPMATVSMLHPSGDPVPFPADGAPAPGEFHRDGSGTPLVLLHGANMSWRAWRPVLPFLTGRHDVFVPTMAGHRGGPALPADSDAGMQAVVDALCEQLDHAGIETAHLAGNSLGGWAALELARRGRARSVTAISPAGCWQSRRDLMRLLWMFRAARTAVGTPPFRVLAANPALRRAWLGKVVEHPGRIEAAALAEMIEDAIGCTALAGALGGRVRLEPLEPFDVAWCPVRVAWAERDKTIPYRRYGHPMRARIPGAEFTTLPGVGHVPMSDDPRLVARTILEVTSAVDEAAAREVPRRGRRRGSRSKLTA